MPDCKSCHTPFEDFSKLADHILKDQLHHDKYSVKWARTYQMRRVLKTPKPQDRQPITEQMKDNREACIRDDISGKQKEVACYCVTCQRKHRQTIPVEFDNIFSWRVNSMLVINCDNCNLKSRRW